MDVLKPYLGLNVALHRVVEKKDLFIVPIITVIGKI